MMKTNKFRESSWQHTLVVYGFINFFVVFILNKIYFIPIYFGIPFSIIISFIYHIFIGYRFYKKIILDKFSLLIMYPAEIIFKHQSNLSYENITSVRVAWSHGGNQSFIKFKTKDESIKFVSHKEDIVQIISLLSEFCSYDVFDYNSREIIDSIRKE